MKEVLGHLGHLGRVNQVVKVLVIVNGAGDYQEHVIRPASIHLRTRF